MKTKITVGLEFEAHRILGAIKGVSSKKIKSPEAKEYEGQLEEEKVGKVLVSLNLDGEFPEELSLTSHLCMIRKRGEGDSKYKDFLAVTFDDNTEMNRLEFVSMGDGISDHRSFLSNENLNDIREVVQTFPTVISKLGGAIGSRQEEDEAAKLRQEKYEFVFPKYSQGFFQNPRLPFEKDALNKAGVIHVTHTFNTNTDPKAQEKFLEFCHSSRKSITEMPTSVVGMAYNNQYRSEYSPSPKIPIELIAQCSEQDILYPMSNTVAGVKEDLKLYELVIKRIETRIERLSNSKEEGYEVRINYLREAAEKVNRTASYLTKTISGKEDNRYVFNSYEYRLQPPINDHTILVEHRAKEDPIVQFVEKKIKHNRFDQSEYLKICTNIDKLSVFQRSTEISKIKSIVPGLSKIVSIKKPIEVEGSDIPISRNTTFSSNMAALNQEAEKISENEQITRLGEAQYAADDFIGLINLTPFIVHNANELGEVLERLVKTNQEKLDEDLNWLKMQHAGVSDLKKWNEAIEALKKTSNQVGQSKELKEWLDQADDKGLSNQEKLNQALNSLKERHKDDFKEWSEAIESLKRLDNQSEQDQTLGKWLKGASDKDKPIILNVNAISGNFQDKANSHWVGIKVDRVKEEIIYIDPLGHEVNPEIKQLIEKKLKGFQIEQMYSIESHPQYGKIVGEGDSKYIEGNDKDCGPFLVEALHKLRQEGANRHEENLSTGTAYSVDTSRERGMLLRKKHIETIRLQQLKQNENLESKKEEVETLTNVEGNDPKIPSITNSAEKIVLEEGAMKSETNKIPVTARSKLPLTNGLKKKEEKTSSLPDTASKKQVISKQTDKRLPIYMQPMKASIDQKTTNARERFGFGLSKELKEELKEVRRSIITEVSSSKSTAYEAQTNNLPKKDEKKKDEKKIWRY